MAESNQQKVTTFSTGVLKKKDACVVLVRTEWNTAIVDALEQGCVATLKAHGVTKVMIVTVPGAVEIPFAIRRTWEERSKKKKPDAVIALGCVVRGDTPHFEYVCETVTQGVLHLNLTLPIPVIFGVLTVDSDEQARERIGGRHGHKGEEAAITALKMIAFNQSIQR